MPPASQDSQGLKIAVAAFVTLAVILAVTTYFGFSNYSDAWNQLEAAKKKEADAITAQGQVQGYLNDLKDKIGLGKADDSGLKEAIKKEEEAHLKKLNDLNNELAKLIQENKQAGVDAQKLDVIVQNATKLTTDLGDVSKQNYLARLAIMSELLENELKLATNLGLDNADLRVKLEKANAINDEKLQVELTKVADANKAKEDSIKEHDGDRQKLLTQVNVLQAERDSLAQTKTKLETQLAEQAAESVKQIGLLTKSLKAAKEIAQQDENIMERPDGLITYVDYNRKEVRTNLNKSMGVQPQMKFTVFDSRAAGVPADKPKGTIELIEVGEYGSRAKITSIARSVDPIRASDLVYSPSFHRQAPARFALIGKIDVDRDGRDDREDLKRMIAASGGVIDYDLPPPLVGQEKGEITGLTTWYVLDNQPPFRGESAIAARREGGADESGFLEKRTAALAKARDLGVRPISKEKLLATLGYSYGMAKPGRVEARNAETVRDLLNPLGRSTAPTAPAGDAQPKQDEPARPDDAMKDDENAGGDAKKDGDN